MSNQATQASSARSETSSKDTLKSAPSQASGHTSSSSESPCEALLDPRCSNMRGAVSASAGLTLDRWFSAPSSDGPWHPGQRHGRKPADLILLVGELEDMVMQRS